MCHSGLPALKHCWECYLNHSAEPSQPQPGPWQGLCLVIYMGHTGTPEQTSTALRHGYGG